MRNIRLPLFTLCILSIGVAQAQINVLSYGAVPDGATDNAAAINKAFAYASSHPGSKVYFPCTTGTTYLVKSPVTFPSHSTIQGDNASNCKIYYNPSSGPGTVHAAFSFINAGYVTLRDIMLATGSSYPPQAITLMGGIHGRASQNLLDNVSIKGYATLALSYSIASEVNTWRNVAFELDGGGAGYGFYTSAQDDFNICSNCATGSNLALFFTNNNFVVFETNNVFHAIGDKIGGGTADHYYSNNAIGMNHVQESVAYEFISGTASQGGPNGVVHVSNTRIENGGYAFYFKMDSQTTVYNLDIEDVTWINDLGQTGYFIYGDGGLMLRQFHMAHNMANLNGVTGPTSVDKLTQSSVDESYGPITVRTAAVDNIFIIRGSGSVSLPSGSSQNAVFSMGVWTTH